MTEGEQKGRIVDLRAIIAAEASFGAAPSLLANEIGPIRENASFYLQAAWEAHRRDDKVVERRHSRTALLYGMLYLEALSHLALELDSKIEVASAPRAGDQEIKDLLGSLLDAKGDRDALIGRFLPQVRGLVRKLAPQRRMDVPEPIRRLNAVLLHFTGGDIPTTMYETLRDLFFVRNRMLSHAKPYWDTSDTRIDYKVFSNFPQLAREIDLDAAADGLEEISEFVAWFAYELREGAGAKLSPRAHEFLTNQFLEISKLTT